MSADPAVDPAAQVSTNGGGTRPSPGPYLEDVRVGDVHRSRLGRTITETDNVWFTCLTMNTNQMHFNDHLAEQTRFGRTLVNSCLTLALVTGLSVADTSENAVANLGWTDVRLPHPVFAGDTVWAETEVLDVRPSASNDQVGIVRVRTRGLNQDGVAVIEFQRSYMLYRRHAPEAMSVFPEPVANWTVG